MRVAKALASPERLAILRLLIERSYNISEIACELDLPLSSASHHIRVLEDAGMIITTERPGLRGAQKICGIAFEDVYLSAFKEEELEEDTSFFYQMGVGQYFDAEIHAPCGIASEMAYLGVEDDPTAFYSNQRMHAQIIWFHHGYVEYRFPLSLPERLVPSRLIFSFELCSEAPGYNNNWPSDISVDVNGQAVALIHARGDYGGTKGVLNPSWWNPSSTQYGILHRLEINAYGSFVDALKHSDVTIADIDPDLPYISLRIGVHEDAENCGGINLFGDQFGNHPQSIQLEIVAKDRDDM